MAWKIQYGIFVVLFLVQGCFGVLLEALGILGGFKPPLDHPCHLKSGVPP